MKKISNDKRIGSKWTAVEPAAREKHFVVIESPNRRSADSTATMTLQAVLTKREISVSLNDLDDQSVWLIGWR